MMFQGMMLATVLGIFGFMVMFRLVDFLSRKRN
jgi:hypothetical protein